MQRFPLPNVPEDLNDICAAYRNATGSYAWLLASQMLRLYPTAPLSAVESSNSIDFLRLRATILEILGDVSACRAIYNFAATQAGGIADYVAQAAALAWLHVDRAFRLDGDSEHGLGDVDSIRTDLLEVVALLSSHPQAVSQYPDLAAATLCHLTHGFALIGAVDDGKKALGQARAVSPEKESMKITLDLGDAVLLACSGQIDEALEFGEIILGRDSEDPLALQIEVRKFLGTWYRAIDRHQDAANHLRIVTELCQSHDLPYMSVVAAMELISSLVALDKLDQVVDTASTALDTAADLGVNNEVVRALDIVLVQTLSELHQYSQSSDCAEIAGNRAYEHGDVGTAITLYEMGAKSALAVNDQSCAANLYAYCAELANGTNTIQARYLRKEAESVLATVGLYPPKFVESPVTQDSPNLPVHQGKNTEISSLQVKTALMLAEDLLQNALNLLVSTPEDDRERAGAELAKWNQLRAWMQDLKETETKGTQDDKQD